MARLAAGDADALGPLYGRYASRIFGLAAQTLDRAAAEEIVQEVFLAVWRKADTFAPARGPFRPWAMRIAHLRVLNELRRRGRRPQLERDPDGLHLLTLPDPEPLPDEAAWTAQRRDALWRALHDLPSPQRRALEVVLGRAELGQDPVEPQVWVGRPSRYWSRWPP